MVYVLSACRFTEAIALGMLIPILPIFLKSLDAVSFDEFTIGLMTLVMGLFPDAPASLSFAQFGIPIAAHSSFWTDEQLTAVLYSTTGFTMAAAQLFSGRLTDVFDRRKPIIIFGMAGGVLSTVYFLILTSYSELLSARIIQGIFFALTFPPLMAIVAYHAPKNSGGRTMGLYATFRLLGFGLGPIVGGMVTAQWGRDVAFATIVILLALSLMLVSFLVPDYPKGDRPKKANGKHILQPTAAQFYILGAVIFLMMVGISSIISFFPTYYDRFNCTEAELSWVFSAFIITRCILQYPCGLLGDHADKKRVLIISLIAYIPLVALQGNVSALWHLILLRLGLGAVSAGISASVTGMAAERASQGNRGRVMGLNTLSFSLGIAIGPLAAFVPSPFIIAALGGLLAIALVTIIIPSDAQHREGKLIKEDSLLESGSKLEIN